MTPKLTGGDGPDGDGDDDFGVGVGDAYGRTRCRIARATRICYRYEHRYGVRKVVGKFQLSRTDPQVGPVVTDPMVTVTMTWVSVSVMHMVGPGAELPGQPEYTIVMSIGTV